MDTGCRGHRSRLRAGAPASNSLSGAAMWYNIIMTDEEFEKFVYDKIAWEQRFCVYQLTSPEGKVYIGLAEKPVEKRWQNGYGYRGNKTLYADIKKFGWDKFRHEIVEDSLTREQAELLEAQMIRDALSFDPKLCYNRKVPKIHPNRDHYTVYQLYFPDGKMYIGKTGQNFKQRFGHGVHYRDNPELTAAIAQCGVENVRIIIVNEGISFESASAMEKSLIEITRSNDPARGYNKSLGGEKEGGWKQERSKKPKKALKHPELAGHTKPKAIICVETGVEYRSVGEASRKTGTCERSIFKVLKGERETAGGWHWKAIESQRAGEP